MNTPATTFAAAAFVALALIASANAYQPGEYDNEALRLLREMSRAIPLRTTSLQRIAPGFKAEKHAGLTWSEAVAEANSRFGQRQPERATFLCKYLEEGSPEAHLAELRLPVFGRSVGTGGGTSREFFFGPMEKPTATITVWLAQGQLIAEPTFGLLNATFDGVVYSNLVFDLHDRLTSANRELPLNSKGAALTVGQNTSGAGGVNYFWAQISAPDGQSESIDYTPDLIIRERWLRTSGPIVLREVYENGNLRKRMHYNQRQVEGGTQSYIEREERFP